jgi:DNA repair protein RecN (Recombination protein N)
MITTLKIKNFAIIENIEINFSKGLNVLTGETGAGKSILIKAIKLLLGARSSTGVVRNGTKEADLQAIFDVTGFPEIISILKESGIEMEDRELIIRRVINNNQSKIYLNDEISTLNLLNRITPFLMDICSQFENRTLFLPENQLNLLDAHSNNDENVSAFKIFYRDILKVKNELKELESSEREKADRLDFCQFQLGELTKINPKKGEDLLLEEELIGIDSNKALVEFANEARDAFFNDESSIITQIETLKNKMSKIKNIEQIPFLANKKEKLNEFVDSLESFGKDFLSYRKTLTYDTERRAQVVGRLDVLRSIKKKFNGSLDLVIEKKNALSNEVKKLESLENVRNELNAQLIKLQVQAKKLGKEIHVAREKTAKIISEKITAQLQDLNMKGAVLQIKLTYNEDKLNALGFDEVEFEFAPNKGELLDSISKIASGGELSRVTLAIHNVFTKENSSKTYVFDEVDTGIGGDTAKQVGKKLKEISQNHQVICISHLAQVAVHGKTHTLLYKESSDERVTTKTKSLETKDQRIKEIARMLSGDPSIEEALEHAEVLLKEVKN